MQNLADYEAFLTWFDAEYATWVRRMYRSRRAKKILKGQAGRLSGAVDGRSTGGFLAVHRHGLEPVRPEAVARAGVRQADSSTGGGYRWTTLK